MDPLGVFLPCFHDPQASRFGHKKKEKISVHNLHYGPRTRIIQGPRSYFESGGGGGGGSKWEAENIFSQ